MVIIALLLATAAQNAGSPTPPPPTPPAMPVDTGLRALVVRTYACADEARDAGNDADRAVRSLDAAPGSPAWLRARELVAIYVERREVGKRCISDLADARWRKGVSANDRRIIGDKVQGLTDFWAAQLTTEVDILAKLVGIKSNAREIMGYMISRQR